MGRDGGVEMMALARDVGGPMASDIYSPPRLTKQLHNMGLQPGRAYDLTTNDEHGEAWGFTKAGRRKEARRRIEAENPWLVVGSHMCESFSRAIIIWKHKRGEEQAKRAKVEATRRIDFCVEIYRDQINRGH